MNYTIIPSNETVEKTKAALTERGFSPVVVETGIEALAKIKELIPAGASVMNGSSTTLNQIGFVDYLKSGEHQWKNLHEDILKEEDPEKQKVLRRQALLADYYLGSIHAMTEDGEMIIASNSGSQLPHIVYSSPNVIFVVSTMKIMANREVAYQRLNEHVIPLEDARMRDAAGVGTYPSKVLLYSKEQAYTGRKINIILVNEQLGF